MATPLQNVNFKISDSFETLLDMVYPVGSVYISVLEASPASFLGGDWTKIGEGRCLAGAGTSDKELIVDRWGNDTEYTVTIPLDKGYSHYVHDHWLPFGSGTQNPLYLMLKQGKDSRFRTDVLQSPWMWALRAGWDLFEDYSPNGLGYGVTAATTYTNHVPQVYGVNIYKRIA